MKCPPKQLLLQAEALGFQLLRANRHAIWRHSESGRQVVTSVTPSDRRALQNALSTMRRVAALSMA